MAKFPPKRLICNEKVVKEGGRLTKNKSDWKFVVQHEDHKFRPHFMLNICNAWEIIKPINTNLEEKHFATRGENIHIRSNQVQNTACTKIQSKVYRFTHVSYLFAGPNCSGCFEELPLPKYIRVNKVSIILPFIWLASRWYWQLFLGCRKWWW